MRLNQANKPNPNPDEIENEMKMMPPRVAHGGGCGGGGRGVGVRRYWERTGPQDQLSPATGGPPHVFADWPVGSCCWMTNG